MYGWEEGDQSVYECLISAPSIPLLQQTEILKLVFFIYFRILKHSRHSPLLQPVLEGLAKLVK